MGQPAAVAGDRIVGTCAGHQVPSPAGNPTAGPPMPFSAPVTQGAASSVLIAGTPALVQGATGLNQPPHTGLHASDPHAVPAAQQGRVVTGSATVHLEGTPAAHAGSQTTMCFGVPGQLMASAADVQIGG